MEIKPCEASVEPLTICIEKASLGAVTVKNVQPLTVSEDGIGSPKAVSEDGGEHQRPAIRLAAAVNFEAQRSSEYLAEEHLGRALSQRRHTTHQPA